MTTRRSRQPICCPVCRAKACRWSTMYIIIAAIRMGLVLSRSPERRRLPGIESRMFHISSPIEGWKGPKPERHHDFIDLEDFPACWKRKKITVEIEAKAKEVAVLKLKKELEQQGRPHTARALRINPEN